MPLMSCPRCGRVVKSSAFVCSGCGEPINLEGVPIAPSGPRKTAYRCPGCGAITPGKNTLTWGLGLALGIMLIPFLLGLPIILFFLPLLPKRCTNCNESLLATRAIASYPKRTLSK